MAAVALPDQIRYRFKLGPTGMHALQRKAERNL